LEAKVFLLVNEVFIIKQINIMNKELTPFQIAFIEDIKESITNTNQYRYLKHLVFKRYSAYGTPSELNAGIDELIKEGYIYKVYKKIYNNGRYSTIIHIYVKEESKALKELIDIERRIQDKIFNIKNNIHNINVQNLSDKLK